MSDAKHTAEQWKITERLKIEAQLIVDMANEWNHRAREVSACWHPVFDYARAVLAGTAGVPDADVFLMWHDVAKQARTFEARDELARLREYVCESVRSDFKNPAAMRAELERLRAELAAYRRDYNDAIDAIKEAGYVTPHGESDSLGEAVAWLVKENAELGKALKAIMQENVRLSKAVSVAKERAS